MPLRVTGLFRYPVKSFRGESVDSARIEPWGIAGDRRWMIIDADGEALTAREHPAMLLLTPPDVQLTHTDREVPVTVHGNGPFPALLAPGHVNAGLSERLGVDARLVHFAEPRHRSVSFADAHPLTLASEASLAQLNTWIADGPLAHEGPLPMVRFRPNVVIDGGDPFAEDRWRRLRVGAATFAVAKACDRCVMTTTDADTAARGKEPIATLSRHRKWDGKVWFATNLVPETPGATVSVGDAVEILG